MECPNCGKTLRDGAAFCGGCGAPIKKSTPAVNNAPAEPSQNNSEPSDAPTAEANPAEAENLCPKCSAVLKPNATFCGKCGAPIEKNVSAPGNVSNDNVPAVNPEVLVKFLTPVRLIAAVCFILNAIFIFIPVFRDDSILTAIGNSLSSLTGADDTQVTYSIVSIFKAVGEGGFHGFAVFLSIVHVILCIASAFNILIMKSDTVRLPILTSAYSLMSFIVAALAAILTTGGISRYGILYPIPFSSNVIWLMVVIIVSMECCNLIKSTVKDFNGGSKK